MPTEARQAVVILGMHRSGTSAVAGTASRLGLTLPRSPLTAAADNPGGFYESLPIVTVNHNLLLAAGCAWNVCLTFDPEQSRTKLTLVDRQHIATTLQSEFDGATSFVLKDPRLCLTLPIWMPTFEAVGAGVRVLVVVRHPAEVVRSLAIRNQLSESDTAPHWLHYMLEAERASRGLNRAIVLYDDLLRNWRRCITEAGQSACVTWPRPLQQAEHEIDRFLAISLRSHTVTQALAVVGPPPACDMINVAWLALRRLSEHPESPDALACLDHVRAEFATWRRKACPPGFRVVFPSLQTV